ncbi:aldehyde dehydrogenase [Gonapodya prolifera JEL478]|uniref:Aldehyde dehydrogenase n=1 Tax=Gonapodya prolifera (strain JEL478) TaxID=1344416 RepID=A0A139AZI0_GONPJ|nr:aldehyde dehydrogenase [Gonapodya prolifera JEL478]|eukprot:KXS22136.1 aldehyde dehydrogenase [Gonapodya prolifera JEL478]
MADSTFRATPIEDFDKIISTARSTFLSGRTKSLVWRKQQLRALYKLIDENSRAIVAALQRDLNKPTTEATVILDLNHIVFCLENLDKWAKPDYPEKGITEIGAGLSVVHEPYGVCLIIAPWNYPFDLVFKPLTSALAAGNVAVLKPSEITPNAATLIAELVPKYLDREAIFVVNGGVKETTALLEKKFDHCTYTGSTAVGKIIMAAAAKHLTPVVLELGGKSPVVLDPKLTPAELTRAAKRLVNTKFFNAGQTCIAPDYVLCPPALLQPLSAAVRDIVSTYFGSDPSTSPDLARIVNKNHTRRIGQLIDQQRAQPGAIVITGGKWDESRCYIEPTIIAGVKKDGPLMSQEIFGPALPILECADVDAAIKFIREGERPLALYVFTSDSRVAEKVHNACVSGSVVINDATYQYAIDSAPFGGIGHSGMGSLHGKYGFLAYTHSKTVLEKPLTWFSEKMDELTGRFPPYNPKNLESLESLAKKKLPSENSALVQGAKIVAGLAVIAGAVSYYMRPK